MHTTIHSPALQMTYLALFESHNPMLRINFQFMNLKKKLNMPSHFTNAVMTIF